MLKVDRNLFFYKHKRTLENKVYVTWEKIFHVNLGTPVVSLCNIIFINKGSSPRLKLT